MDPKIFHDKWNVLQPKIKQKWSKFTDQDLKQINGEKTKFLTELQKKYGIDKSAAEQELKKITDTLVGAGANAGAQKGNAPQKPGAQPQKTPQKPPQKK
jgi:uncharacterized protein YjbJ (UPF0337 family)